VLPLSFGLGVICFVLGSVAIAICIAAIPGRPGAAPAAPADHGHGGH